MAVAEAFEGNAALSAKDTKSYSLTVCDKIHELTKICEARCWAEAEAEMSDEEEEFDSLQEVMEELDRVLDYDRTLEQGVADFEKWGRPEHGRVTFLALRKGSEGRARILSIAERLPSKKFFRELEDVNSNPEYDDGYSEEEIQAKVLSRQKTAVATWQKMVQNHKPIKSALGKRAQSIAKALLLRKPATSDSPVKKKKMKAAKEYVTLLSEIERMRHRGGNEMTTGIHGSTRSDLKAFAQRWLDSKKKAGHLMIHGSLMCDDVHNILQLSVPEEERRRWRGWVVLVVLVMRGNRVMSRVMSRMMMSEMSLMMRRVRHERGLEVLRGG
jgi:hypothetical protein